MAHPESTCWTVIQAAAAGRPGDREEFARRYAPVVRAYLAARWRASPCLNEFDDAVQEVFVECFKQGGTLERAERGRPGGCRAFLYGMVRHVAQRLETNRVRCGERPPPSDLDLAQIEARETSLSQAFDRATELSRGARRAGANQTRPAASSRTGMSPAVGGAPGGEKGDRGKGTKPWKEYVDHF